MQIQKINQISLNRNLSVKKSLNQPPANNYQSNNNQLPAAYMDFNVSFGAQINRTPANFYAFNKNNLPDSMKNYLNADYDDRKNMPPAQMMKLVYDDLNQIKSLDFVSRIYPEESLFADLSDSPNRKAKKGLVAQVETLKEEFDGAPLFKDGSSNFGMYLLKKIYLEGKQKKEINDDFYKDLSREYDGLITEPVDYSTFRAYGIKFPKVSFWNSFVVTRDDWNYIYKPRKVDGPRISSGEKSEMTLSDILSGKVQPIVKPPKFKVNNQKVDKMADAVLNGHGDSRITEKLLKRKGVNDNEELSFVSRYLSQIMSIALENMHASDEMRNFFEHYDTMNKKQRDKLEFYWKNNPQMRLFQSIAMSDTIKLFFETYGVDGNNEEFQGLLNYADSIKPARELRIMLHNKKQAEYDAMFAELDALEALQTASVPAKEDLFKNMSKEEIDRQVELEAIKNGAHVFTFVTAEGKTYKYICNVDEMFEKNVHKDLSLLPISFVNKYYNFMKASPLATPEYRKNVALRFEIADELKDQMASIEDISAISAEINKEFAKKSSRSIDACNQAVVQHAINLFPEIFNLEQYLDFNSKSITHLLEDKLNITNWSSDDMNIINKLYLEYNSPIVKKEDINKVNKIFVDYLYNLDLNKPMKGDLLYDDLIKLLSANLKMDSNYKKILEKMLRQTNFTDEIGGTAKLLLDPNAPESLKKAKCYLIAEDLIRYRVNHLMPLLILNTQNIQKYVNDDSIRETLFAKAIFKQ